MVQRTNTIKVDDIVLVHSDTAKRSSWPLAVVAKLNHVHDGMVRSVDIRTEQTGQLQGCTHSKSL